MAEEAAPIIALADDDVAAQCSPRPQNNTCDSIGGFNVYLLSDSFVIYIDLPRLGSALAWPRNETLFAFDIKTSRTLIARRDASVIQGHPQRHRLALALPLTQ